MVAALIAGRYDALEEGGRSGRLSARELRVAVETFGRTLTPIPEAGWAIAQVFAQQDGAFSVDLPLWTAEEGRSDLTLCLTMRIGAAGPDIEIDDLRVL